MPADDRPTSENPTSRNRATQKGQPLGQDSAGSNIFDADLMFPVAVLFESAINHNSTAVMSFCKRHNVSLAPHGKTTMAPALFRRQIADGAWAISAATTWQAMQMRDAGVERVLIANEVVVPAEIRWLVDSRRDGFDVMCYVDSLEGVEIMNEVLAAHGLSAPLPVLVEMGIPQGRTGTRSLESGLAVAAAAARSPHLALTGVAGFEGILGPVGDRSAQEVVSDFLDTVVELTHLIDQRGLFEPTPEVIVTAGGSAYFDHVVERFARIRIANHPVRIVVRSGGYISHDDIGLHRVSPLGASPRIEDIDPLRPAIEVWGAVLSRPEPTRALIGVGKRDVSGDGRLPIAKKIFRRKTRTVESIGPIDVATLNDQHAFLDIDPSFQLDVGDLIGFGIGHPCTTFDKWRTLLMVDDDYRITEVVETSF